MKNEITVRNIYEFLDSIAPFETQCEWDNSGLLIGDPDKRVGKICVVLDITPEAVRYASKRGADLIVSHHPVIFKPVGSVISGSPVYDLVSEEISAICAHTCLDKARGGVNDALAEKLGFAECFPFCDEGDAAMIRICRIPLCAGEDLAKKVAEKLGGGVRLADTSRAIRTVALCGGAGSDFLKEAKAAGCDAYITGDASHHDFLNALDMGIALLAAGHFETENPVVEVLAKKLSDRFGIEVLTIPQTSPVKYYK